MRSSGAGAPRRTSGVAYDLIESDAALAKWCAEAASSTLLAFDTEFVGEKTYWPDLELVQVCDEKRRIALIDVRAIGDNAPLADLLLDPKREKILHSGSQDIVILRRWLGAAVEPLFDTQVAAAMVGVGAQVSYANLVSKFCGATLSKDHTVSDWSRRPLSEAQLAYAADDVVHLHELRERLLAELDASNREEWYREEQHDRVQAYVRDFDSPTPEEDLFKAVKEWGKLKGRQLAILQKLAIWRDREAQRRNEPRRKLMPDAALIGLARMAPKTKNEIRSARQIPQGPVNRFIDELLALVEEGSRVPREQWPRKEYAPAQDIPPGITEMMQALLRIVAEEENIAATLLATSSELAALANNRHDAEGLDLPVLRGWRRRLVGEKLLALLGGRISLRIEGRDRMVFEETPPHRA